MQIRRVFVLVIRRFSYVVHVCQRMEYVGSAHMHRCLLHCDK